MPILIRLIGGGRRKISARDRADAARDAKQYRAAALLYEQVLRADPDDAAIHIQCGHMHKEARNLEAAEQHYERARNLTPDDPDLSLQLGHFYKVAGRLRDAELSYRRAIELDPDWPEPAVQLGELYRRGWMNRTRPAARGGPAAGHSASAHGPPASPVLDLERDGALRLPRIKGRLVPELAPRRRDDMLVAHEEGIYLHRFGRRELTYWGVMPTFRGIQAIRGFCVSAVPIVQLRIVLNGLRFWSGPLQAFPLKYEKYNDSLRKNVFNIWYDFSNFANGPAEIELQFADENGGLQLHREAIAIADPLSVEQHPSSDGLVSFAVDQDRPLDRQINSQPSMLRPARRLLLPRPPRTVLIQRLDQLGDMISSIPALHRLREILPAARFVGLLSPTAAEVARTLGLFEEIIAVDFPDDPWERRRVMPLEQQAQLRKRLEPYKFDVAIDLTEATVTRPLLLLSGAPFLFGFKDPDAPWLSAGFEAYTSDPLNTLEEVPHTNKILGLIEYFGSIIARHAQVVRRTDLSQKLLAPYGILETDRYAVLHTGARIEFSRWPYYRELASMIIERTDLKVVMLTDDPREKARLMPDPVDSARFRLLDQRVPFDEFDALLSFCTVFVGNDSGPKHLAALRGAKVVSIHMARNNWNEWGHENEGYILSRRVPCAGCVIHHFPEDCGKEFACITNIRPEEVFAAVQRLL